MHKLFNLSQYKCAFLIGFLFVNISVFSQIPSGYYNSAEGLSGDQLKSALHNIIDNHTEYSYDYAKTILKESDEDPSNSSNVILLYTGRSQSKSSFGGGANDWNREHVWAKSHGDFGTSAPAGSDCHHLRPTDASVNSSRSNKDFDNGGTAHSEATECNSTSSTWEPRDAVKGDVARMMFYMVIRYEGDESGEPDLELVDYVTGSTSAPKFGVLSTLLQWHNNDPVDDFERNRNNVVYSYQNNRNPFVDHPEYVSRIWNSNAAASITEITQTPSEPDETDNVEVTAVITDAEGIKSVNLNWGTSESGLTTTISMSNTSGDTYTSTSAIPAQALGTHVYYKIVVIDNEDEPTSSLIKDYLVGGEVSLGILLDEDFETGTDQTDLNISGWTNFNEIGTRKWQGRTFNSNYYAQTTSYGSDEENVSWLVSPKVDLSLVTNPEFSFDVNVGYWRHNGLQILISTDYNGSDVGSATWTDLSSNFTIPTTPTDAYGSFATAGTYNLADYSGNVYFAFKYSGDATNEHTTTYQIDNVLVSGIANNQEEDVTPPALTYTPEHASTNVLVESLITIQANEPLRTSGGTIIDEAYLKSIISLNKGSEQGESHGFSANINSNNTEIIITPDVILASETTYFFSIAANSVQDTAGNKIAEKQIVQFTTKATVDEFPPELLGSSLSANLKTVEFEFSENIANNLSTNALLISNVTMSNNGTEYSALPASSTININQNILQINLSEPLSQLYNKFALEANTIKDLANNVLAEKIYSEIFDASGNDTLAPVFAFGYPKVSEISSNSFKCSFKIDEPGEVFYKLQEAGSVPTINEMLNEVSIKISDETKEHSVVFSQLNDYTDYALYLIVRDNVPEPNVSESINYMAVRTKAISPEIISNPEISEVCLGAKAMFQITATGSEPLIYQWFFNDQKLEGEESSVLSLNNVIDANFGAYYCAVSNTAGAVNSKAAQLLKSAEVWSGNDSTITVNDTTSVLKLFSCISSGANMNGKWVSVDNNSALSGDEFLPWLAGIGEYDLLYITENECGSDTAVITVQVIKNGVGVNNKTVSSLNIHPNPSNGVFYIENENGFDVENIIVYTLEGKQVSFDFVKGDAFIEIQLNSEPGIYTIKLIEKGHIRSAKLIIN